MMINKRTNLFLVVFFINFIAYFSRVSRSDIQEDKSDVGGQDERPSSPEDDLGKLESLASRIKFLEDEIARFKKPLDGSCTKCSAYNYKVSVLF